MSNPQRPLTNEERAAKEARLRQLRAQMNTTGGAPAHPGNNANYAPGSRNPYNNNHYSNHTYTNNTNNNHNHHMCDDEQYSDEDDDHSDAEDEFLREIEREQGLSGGVHVYETHMVENELLGQTVETVPSARRRTVGDFELLRLAKMGDLVSFRDFAVMTGVNATTFRDNHGRNALHYAADSGDCLMLQYLLDQGVPFARDEKRMTPMDIAVLNRHDAAVRLLASAFPEEAEHAPLCPDAAVAAFAPPPPRFTLAKPAPPERVEERPRAFWCAAPPPPSPSLPGVGGEARPAAAAALRNGLARDGHGLLAWLPPATRPLEADAPNTVVVAAGNGEGAVGGVAAAVGIGGALVGAGRCAGVAVVTHFAVQHARRGMGIGGRLLTELRQALVEGGHTQAVVFLSPKQLPVKAVGLVKWSRRSLRPWDVFKRPYAAEIFPDFYKYDDILRADIVAKNALTESVRKEMKTRGVAWRPVDRENAEHVTQVFEFITHHATKTFGLAYVPENTEDVRSSVLAVGVSAFVHVSKETGDVTDMVALRLRGMESNAEEQSEQEKESTCEDNDLCASCVYALFTSFKGVQKTEEVLLLASILKCETLFVPNMFGFVDSDLSKAHFEELLAFREYLYVLKDTMLAAFAPMPLSGVGIPCSFI